ncbi:alkyl hydroperoxide reductase subunit F [Marinibactrum halimedae]|uniref:Alkyl hydroperoxide reductase subunit F n=1 Tax=Marinibactrum halimedae TaxID=1444977 RepID=A0AA37TDD2_9GAMM|nr:alkyl hydroperoxide reductase subunit F [Marinibactrum halimedae]MCD9458014.1 alkyl hydroperoxide reductase subunit F [Marinibactrum halimedae]GLS27640.1 alkyl hydroperoxide reductase subunit F [Marinibactrum halimedae]
MITPEILTALKGYAEHLKKNVTLVLQTGDHTKRAELVEFLQKVATVSDKLTFEERDSVSLQENQAAVPLRSAVSFTLEVQEGEAAIPTGVVFSGIPGGHEFNSFVLAVLHAGGHEIKLDDSVIQLVQGISTPLKFETFISLSCHNCPDVVQALNQFALLNPQVSNEMIDGGLYPELIEERDIQGVPSVYLNGELFANGKVEVAELVDKLIERFPPQASTSQTNQLPVQDVTVIGGGPAGVSAAIYSARKGLNVTLVADRLGGQVKDTMGIENLISVSKTTGPELVGALQNHMQDYDITTKEHVRVVEVNAQNGLKEVTLSTGEVIQTKALIVATGARWRELGIPGEKENIGNGVAYCPHCDGPFFKGKDVAVIGGGNSGVEAALDLAGIVKSVKLYEFMPELKADQVLIDKAKATANIEIYTNAATQAIEATSGKVSALSYQDRNSGEIKSHSLEGVFVQIGLVPNSQFIKDVVEVSPYGEIVIDEKCRTSIPGVFACGDVTTVPYKQIVISMGEGAKASLSAFEYLLTEFDAEVNDTKETAELELV